MFPLQVIDDQGVDRTPKPLISLDPSGAARSMYGGSVGTLDDSTPASEASELMFLNRMASANFSRQGGWQSGATSGTVSPKGEAEDDYEGGTQAMDVNP